MRHLLLTLSIILLPLSNASALSPVEGKGCYVELGTTVPETCSKSIIICRDDIKTNQVLYGDSIAILCEVKATNESGLRKVIAKQRHDIRKLQHLVRKH